MRDLRETFYSKTNRYRRTSYAQAGEDRIISFVLNDLGISKPTYWDIGAFHPFQYSNTASFYFEGSCGLVIEPNVEARALFDKYRPRDTFLNCGLGQEDGDFAYFQTSSPSMNSFSHETVSSNEKHGISVIDQKIVSMISPKTCSDKFFESRFPDFLSIDIEGEELGILNSFDLTNNRIPLICVETISYSTNGHGIKSYEVKKYLEGLGYIEFADTYINTIFVLENLWRR